MDSDDIIENENISELRKLEEDVESEAVQSRAKSPNNKSPWKAFVLTGLIASLFGAAGGGYGVFAGLKAKPQSAASSPSVDLSPMEAKIKRLAARLEAAEASVKKTANRPAIKSNPIDLSALEKRMEDIESAAKTKPVDLSGFEKRLDSLEAAPKPEIDPAALKALQSAQKDGFEWPDTARLETRLQALETKLETASEPKIPESLLKRLETLEEQSGSVSADLPEGLEARLTALENRPVGAAQVSSLSSLAFPKAAMVSAVKENVEGGVFKKALSRHVRVKDENDPIALIEGIEADIAKGRLDAAVIKFDRLPAPIRAAGQAWYESVKASL